MMFPSRLWFELTAVDMAIIGLIERLWAKINGRH